LPKEWLRIPWGASAYRYNVSDLRAARKAFVTDAGTAPLQRTTRVTARDSHEALAGHRPGRIVGVPPNYSLSRQISDMHARIMLVLLASHIQ